MSLSLLRTVTFFLAAASVSGCNHAVRSAAPAPRPQAACATCAIPMSDDVAKAVETRLANLKERGGDCAAYGQALEAALRSGRITIRPYMWRVGTNLAAGEAKPSGEMLLARDIDSLNIGVRTVDEITHTMEHEAVHIAFDIPSDGPQAEAKVNSYVAACRS